MKTKDHYIGVYELDKNSKIPSGTIRAIRSYDDLKINDISEIVEYLIEECCDTKHNYAIIIANRINPKN